MLPESFGNLENLKAVLVPMVLARREIAKRNVAPVRVSVLVLEYLIEFIFLLVICGFRSLCQCVKDGRLASMVQNPGAQSVG